jgi:myo-inositol-1(or 4)-monophosphatase
VSLVRRALVAAAQALTAELLDLAVGTAQAAGAQLLERQDQVHRVQYKTTDTDPVSEADQAAEQLITAALTAARPADGMLGEEGADRGSATGLRWVVDPLDGTVNYLYGHPSWAVSIACEDADGALVGVVHQPTTQRTFTAVRGEGASLNGAPLRVNDPVSLGHALLGTGFAYDAEQRRRQAGIIAAVLPQVRDIRRIGSAALDLCMVAAGELDAYYEDTTARWDWAAGELIAAEAGAQVEHFGDGLMVAGPALFPPLRTALVGAGTL